MRGLRLEHIDAVGMVAQRFGRLHANKAAANHHDTAFTAFRMRALGCCEHIVPSRQRIIERNERMHVRAALHAGNRRNEGDASLWRAGTFRSESSSPASLLDLDGRRIQRHGFKIRAPNSVSMTLRRRNSVIWNR